MKRKETKKQTDAGAEGRSRRERERRLDEGLKESFPASDPLAVGRPTGTEPLPPLVPRKKK